MWSPLVPCGKVKSLIFCLSFLLICEGLVARRLFISWRACCLSFFLLDTYLVLLGVWNTYMYSCLTCLYLYLLYLVVLDLVAGDAFGVFGDWCVHDARCQLWVVF